MGLETIAIGAAVGSAVVGGLNAKNQMDAAGKQAGLQKQSAAAQTQQAFNEQQLLEAQKQLAASDHALNASQQGDQRLALMGEGAELSIAERQLAEKRSLLQTSAARLQQDAASVMAQVQNAHASLALQAAATRAGATDKVAQTVSEAARQMGTMRVMAGEAGLSGSSIVAAAREIAHLEGTNLGQVAAAAGRELEGIGLEREKVGLQALGTLNDLGRRGDQILSEGQQNTADMQRAVVARGTLGLKGRQIERDAQREDLNYQRSQLGITGQQSQLETRTTLLGLESAAADVQRNAAAASGVYSMIGSGLSIASSWATGRMTRDAQADYYKRLQTAAQNRGP